MIVPLTNAQWVPKHLHSSRIHFNAVCPVHSYYLSFCMNAKQSLEHRSDSTAWYRTVTLNGIRQCENIPPGLLNLPPIHPLFSFYVTDEGATPSLPNTAVHTDCTWVEKNVTSTSHANNCTHGHEYLMRAAQSSWNPKLTSLVIVHL